ncbi:hypothetical protein [Streptomyces sp. NPDC005969]|uniref:hypothetical protein n=1 Tax=Streptomyces sp. NPDC005969 TaxID=3156722 RepID=UPI0033D24C90
MSGLINVLVIIAVIALVVVRQCSARLTLLARSGALTRRSVGISPAYGGAVGGLSSQPVWKDRM